MEDVLVGDSELSLATPIDEDKSPAQAKEEKDEEKAELELAATTDEKGWPKLREMIEKDIDACERLTEVDLSRLNDLQLGRAVRVEQLLAAKLRSYLEKIDNAAAFREQREQEDEDEDDES